MFTVVPFGLKIMTGHMQKIMERLLENIGIVPFQDDTAVASKSVEEHIATVKKVLEVITYEAGLRIRFKKCKFFKTEARVLGMIVSREGIRMDPQKIEAIVNWQKPMTGKAIQRFMGAANFNREFSHKFAEISAPLEGCKNEKTIVWNEEREKAFENLKKLFQENILLTHVDWKKQMFLTTDASQIGIGAWLGQINDKGELVPVICASRKLSPTEQRWPATKRELYALMWAMKKFRHYLLGRHFVARVDHKPLIALLKNRMTMLTEGWIETIMEFSFTTEYLPGEKNQLADALSRSFEGEVNAVTIQRDEQDEQTRLKWEAEKRGCILPPEDERVKLVQQQHALGHFGVQLMFEKIIEEGFWWPKMRAMIAEEIGKCDGCLQYNVQSEGPFTVVRQDRGGAYVLMDELGEEMSPKRTIEMLKVVTVAKETDGKSKEMEQKGAKESKNQSKESVNKSKKQSNQKKQEATYEVKRILDHRAKDGQYEYKVQWKGYKRATWEPESNFNERKVIVEYWRRNSKEKQKGKQVAGVAIAKSKQVTDRRSTFGLGGSYVS